VSACPKCKTDLNDGICPFCGFVVLPPRPPNRLDWPDVTPLERLTIGKLRSESGWWMGDARAIDVLRFYIKSWDEGTAWEKRA
jgi:hypothetical protein